MRSLDSLEDRLSLEQKFLPFDIAHCIGLVFSMFALPFFVGFDIEPMAALLAVDGLLVVESIAFVVLNLVIYKRQEKKWYNSLQLYYQNGLVHDIVACTPLNLILWSAGVNDPAWVVAPFRVIRLIAV
jgi:hypothetical protein